MPTVANQKCQNVVEKCQKIKIVRSSQNLAYNYSSTREMGFQKKSCKISSLVPTVANQKCHSVVQKCQKMKVFRSSRNLA